MYSLNGVNYESKQTVIDFVNSEQFVPFLRKSLLSPQKADWFPSEGDTILRFNIMSSDGLEVTSELKRYKLYYDVIKYNWYRTYETARRSGGNYDDKSDAQKQAYFDLDDIQNAVESKLGLVGIKLG